MEETVRKGAGHQHHGGHGMACSLMLDWDLQENGSGPFNPADSGVRGRRHISAAPSGMPFLIPNSFAPLVESGKTNGLKHPAQYHSGTKSTAQEPLGKGEASEGAKPVSPRRLGLLLLNVEKHPPSVAASDLRDVWVNWGFGDFLDLIYKSLWQRETLISVVPQLESGKMP